MQDSQLPVHARLYTTGVGRRYRRASVHPGPGEPLTLVSEAKRFVQQEVAIAIAAERQRLINALRKAATEPWTERSQRSFEWALSVLERA